MHHENLTRLFAEIQEAGYMLSHYKEHELKPVLGAGLRGGVSAEMRSGAWECCLAETVIGDYLLVPLTTTTMLTYEWHVMNIYFQDYSDQCADQKYCIFSIRSRSGERLATLGLAKKEGYWCFDQCLGPSNTEVLEETLSYLDEEDVLQTEYFPTEMYYVAHEVVRLMNCTGSKH